MGKTEEFIEAVKMASIVYAAKAENTDAKRAAFRAIELVEDAKLAANRIPESVTAADAAIQFIDYHVRERDQEFDDSYSWLCTEG